MRLIHGMDTEFIYIKNKATVHMLSSYHESIHMILKGECNVEFKKY